MTVTSHFGHFGTKLLDSDENHEKVREKYERNGFWLVVPPFNIMVQRCFINNIWMAKVTIFSSSLA